MATLVSILFRAVGILKVAKFKYNYTRKVDCIFLSNLGDKPVTVQSK